MTSNEHNLYDKLRHDARRDKSVRLQKIHGSSAKSGDVDIQWSCYAGNFAVELKYIPVPKRQNTEVDPYILPSELQYRALKEIWELNGMSALAVGFHIQSTLFIKFFPGLGPLPQPWKPRVDITKMCMIKRLRQSIDFEAIADILAAFVKYRFGLIEWEDIP